ncbi:hypothetical protein XO10_03590 [Marinitoga sp. 1135]|uniref:DUF3783 domain-containing protein n=1 Tax=Marinitoga piezophila (strain DSM 14283 / JCM 11233 / KA3) TaxID=443254 RepID=H2J6G1_MARPK|nr:MULTISPECIES: DUF3783 domain-containing protein [Marinitoga]AEX85146.1 hypothetical protein Marpi_0712 [Marinitoga piezophila KA3]APT75645.1 hypothetical protein LN42_04010 [Marinitoga sp. 1137]NUU95385.1 hypothetical protein [Marinitoga sp. 1135]NUU97313.1 hypothetical protein [Marinitoga sp. 1138]
MYDEIKDTPTIILNGFSSEEINKIMKAIKNTEGLPRIIFATTTKVNVNWTIGDLIKELKNEDIEVKKALKKAMEDKNNKT